ncbi:hypothetical protein MMC30_006689 [Trapelia coarctata]|nr:hypothetical protein [Trapelia coarctata]
MSIDRNIYREDVDFSALALQDPEFNKFVKSNGQLDFSNPEAVKQLTKSLLKRDFGLKLELPDDRLCPPVPNRLNYILWIQDLLDTTSDSYTDRYNPDRGVTGLDIGTGASCIYPLLGCIQRPKWRFAVTDIDEKNLEYAKRNIIANGLKNRIRPLKTEPNGPLIPLDAFGLDSIDFTICNPPFYASPSELLASAAAKSRPPHSACTGADIEMVTPGGEIAFVTRMIDESCRLKERVQWYTSMLGKYSSVSSIIEKLKAKGIGNWAVKEFVQGGKTRRWGVAWSWGDMRPRMDVARGIGSLPKHLLPFPSQTSISLPETTLDAAAAGINSILQRLDLKYQYRPQLSTGVGFVKENVWSRAARRSKQKVLASSVSEPRRDFDFQTMDEDSDEEEVRLGFKIEVRQGGGGEVVVGLRWLKGVDAVLWESFCGMLRRGLVGGG